MDIRVRRALLPALLATAFLLLVGWHAVPARAVSVDPELVAESVSEDGYYVDSSASYLKSDADLDKLREAIEGAGRAGVVVLPAGAPTAPVISQLLHMPNRRATYVVMSGGHMQVVSNNLPSAKVSGLAARARRAGNPASEVLTFLNLLSGKHAVTSGAKVRTHEKPSTAASTDDGDIAASSTPMAAAEKDSGGNGVLYGVIGLVVVVVLAAIGFVLWRRKQGTDGPDGSGPGMGGPGMGGPGRFAPPTV